MIYRGFSIAPEAAYFATQSTKDSDIELISNALARMKSAEDGYDDTLAAEMEEKSGSRPRAIGYELRAACVVYLGSKPNQINLLAAGY